MSLADVFYKEPSQVVVLHRHSNGILDERVPEPFCSRIESVPSTSRVLGVESLMTVQECPITHGP